MTTLTRIDRQLSNTVDKLSFDLPTRYVYNPLKYARAPHEAYLERFGGGSKEALFMGMNPGPFGMAQTGVAFGEVALVRDWMGIDERVRQPPAVHPKRPIQGFQCERSEVSGRRLWSWVKDRFGTADAFFERFFVINYCPLCFMEESGRNRTPDKLPIAERAPLVAACDRALRQKVALLQPEYVIGIGVYARDCARRALYGPDGDGLREGDDGPRIAHILHPSPASPKANRGWAPQAEQELAAIGISL